VNILDLKNLLDEFQYTAQDVQILLGDKKYTIKQVYLDDHSDGTYKIVIEGEDK